MLVRHAMVRPEPCDLDMCFSESAGLACAEKAQLLRFCALAESSHQLAIQQLTWIRATLMKHDYEDPQELAENAKDIVKDAQRAVKDVREALDLHTAEHGC
jgi:hypothetical protein